MTDDPGDPDLRRRSRTPAVGPWVALGLIAMLALAAYVISAVSA